MASVSNSSYGSTENSDSDISDEDDSPQFNKEEDVNSTYDLDIEGPDSPVRRVYPNLDPVGQRLSPCSSLPGSSTAQHASSSLRQRREKPASQSGKTSIYPTLPASGKTPTAKSTPEPQAARHRTLQNVQHQQPQSGNCTWLAIAIALLVLVGIVYTLYLGQHKSINSSPFRKRVDSLKLALTALKERYPAQERRTWITVSAAYKSVLRTDDPVSPAVLLLSANDSARLTSQRLARDLARLMHDVMGVTQDPLERDMLEIAADDPDEAKLELDAALHQALRVAFSAVTLHNIQACPPRTALLLHSFCDNDMAPYRQAAIVLSLNRGNEHFKDSEDVITRSWAPQLDEDKVGALRSRIANNLIHVMSET